jgi:HlyD family secretion protein
MIPSGLPRVAILALLLAGCSGEGGDRLQGYVEGTFVYLSAEAGGRLVERPVAAGATVDSGALVFRLDDADETAAVAGAKARLAQAQSQLADLKLGKREAEIQVIAAQLTQARATLSNAEDDYRRKLLLREKGVVAQAAIDDAKAQRDQAQAAADAIARQLDVAHLPARPDEIEAAERNVTAQQAALDQAEIALQRRTLSAPAKGVIAETYYEPGELVTAGQPVVSLLPDANRKIRFYVAEPQLSQVAPGGSVGVSCDGCGSGMSARIDFIATEAEFTPPILYSEAARQKLVYRVEAVPAGDAAALKVGQPLDITLRPAGTP